MFGIVVFAFGKKGYAYSAFNLGMSLKKHSPGLHRTLFIDQGSLDQIPDIGRFYNEVRILQQEDYTEDGKIDPAKLKCSIYDYLPYRRNLYLDADTLCLKDISPLCLHLCVQHRFYLTHVMDKGGKADENIAYNLWATNEDKWKFFKLADNAIYPAIQSSWAYIERSPDAERFFAAVKANRNYPLDKLKMRWGGTLPDELIFSGTCAQFGIVPDYPMADEVMLFGKEFLKGVDSPGKMAQHYYFLSLFGGHKAAQLVKLRYLEWYDKLVGAMARENGLNFTIHRGMILRDKHLNNN